MSETNNKINIVSIRVGHELGEWLHEYLLSDIVSHLRLGCKYFGCTEPEYTLLFGTSHDHIGRQVMTVYQDLYPNLVELWSLVGELECLETAVEIVYKKYFKRSTGIKWDDVKCYRAMQGRIKAGTPGVGRDH